MAKQLNKIGPSSTKNGHHSKENKSPTNKTTERPQKAQKEKKKLTRTTSEVATSLQLHRMDSIVNSPKSGNVEDQIATLSLALSAIAVVGELMPSKHLQFLSLYRAQMTATKHCFLQ